MRVPHANLFFIPTRHRRRTGFLLLAAWAMLVIGALGFAAIERFGIVRAPTSFQHYQTGWMVFQYAAAFALLACAILPVIQIARSIERDGGKSWCVACAHPLLTDAGATCCSECGCEQDAGLSKDIYQLSGWKLEDQQVQQHIWATKPAVRHTPLNAAPYHKLVQPQALSRPLFASIVAALLWIPIGLIPSARLGTKDLESGFIWLSISIAFLILALSTAAWMREQRRHVAAMLNGFACIRCANPLTQTESVEPCSKCKFKQHPARSKEIWQMVLPIHQDAEQALNRS